MMKNIFLLFLLSQASYATCFLAVENEKILQEEGACDEGYSPCSTFKIPLSLIGFEEGILINETNPTWPFQTGYADDLDFWKTPHTPQMWIKNSCVWFSQVMTQKLGMKKFKDYVTKFDYGNQDLSGGLKRSWLMSSLTISPREQVRFLQKFLKKDLGLKENTYTITKNILYVGELEKGWQLYGKTGTGHQWNTLKTTQNPKLHQGWFVGWIEKEGRQIVFAKLLLDQKEIKDDAPPGGPRAREEAKKKLLKLVQEDQKWRIGGKIHFADEDGKDCIGCRSIHEKTRKCLKKYLKFKEEKTSGNTKIHIVQKGHDLILQDWCDHGRGEELHATLLYTKERGFYDSETLQQNCPVLFQDCKAPPPLEKVVKKYHQILKKDDKFQIKEIVLYKKKNSAVISAVLLHHGKERFYKDQNPISAGLHLTLVQCSNKALLSAGDSLVQDLNQAFKNQWIKIGSKNEMADLEFGLSGEFFRIRAGERVELK